MMQSVSGYMKKAAATLTLGTLVLLPQAEAAQACRLGDTRVERMAPITVTAPARTGRWREFWASGTYVADPGWAITRFDYNITEGRPNHLSYRWIGNGGSYASRESIRSAYRLAINAAARANDNRLAARLRNEMNYALEISSSVRSSQGAVGIRVMRRAAGAFRKSRTVTLRPRLRLVCVGTPAQIERRLEQQIRRSR
jgi:hypothetical protein